MPAAVNGIKECTGCKQSMPTSEYCKDRATRDGYSYKCKACNSKKYKKYYYKNIEYHRERVKEWNRKNKEHVSEYNKQYREQNKEYIAELHARNWRNAPAAVYRIFNKTTGRSYIGQTTGLTSRITDHKRELAKNEHKNIELQQEYNKHGPDAIVYEIIQEYPCDTSSTILRAHEQRLIHEYIYNGKPLYNQAGTFTAFKSNKKCIECLETKDVSSYNKSSRNPDGLEYLCRSCYSTKRKARRAKKRKKA